MAQKELKIYFTSDLHAFIYPTDYRSQGEKDQGLFKCANRFEKDGNTLVIDGGDLLQGSPLGAFCHDSVGSAAQFAQMMNQCGYDFVTLGNHDFNFGQQYLAGYLDALDGCCVCQNVQTQDGATKFPWQLKTLANGLRVGVVGIVTDHVNVWERPEHLEGIAVTDPFKAAKEALAQMKEQADVTVCVYHGGFEKDLDTGKLLSESSENVGCRICEELDFDILLTGHQHMPLPGRYFAGTYIVQPADAGREFHELTVRVEDGKKQITSKQVPAGGACEAALLEQFCALNEGAQNWLDVMVGRLDKPLVTASHLEMAAGYSSLAAFFNQVQKDVSGAQLSVASLANEVSGLPVQVHRRDVLTAYPYANTLAVLEVSGRVLREAIERSAEYFALDEQGKLCVSNKFLKPKVEHYNYDYYSGVEYTVDVRRPEGQRVTSLTFAGKEVKDEDVFSLCLNSYRASGAGGYPAYSGCKVLREIEVEMADLILEFFKKHPSVSVEDAKPLTLVY